MKEETMEKIKQNAKKDFSYAINESGEYRDTWRIFRIMAEFVEGYQFLTMLEKEVTMMGSARLREDNPHYAIARELGSLLAKKQYTVMTGGGPGIMEAANRGAHEAGGISVGINIQLPFEQRVNPYVNKSTAFYYFFTRKVMLTSPAHAFVFFPGGYGTLDEFFEVVNYIELGNMCQVPIILIGASYWRPLLNFLEEKCAAIDPKKLDIISEWKIVDSATEAFALIEAAEAGPRVCELSAMNFHAGQKNMDWRIFRIMAELVEGFEFLTGLIEDVTILGTRYIDSESRYYRSAYAIGHALASDGFTVVTGGGAGVSEAANKGAMEAGGKSYGIGIERSGASDMNSYLTKSIQFTFPFIRKLIVTAPSKAFVFFPGGFGTLHHLFEVLTLIQTEKMEPVPVILFDTVFWKPLDQFIRLVLDAGHHTISSKDAALYTVVDTESEALAIIDGFRHKFHKKNT